MCKLKTGKPSPDPAACASGFAADGFCCDTACAGACDVCAKALGASADGVCSSAPVASAGDPACPVAYACNGKSPTCPASCVSDDDCSNSHYCAADGSCQKRKKQATTCNASAGADCKEANCRACYSGFCVDGFCCDTACSAAEGFFCQACAASLKQSGAADGECGPAKQYTNPHADECLVDPLKPCLVDGTCSGSGSCNQAAKNTTPCGDTSCIEGAVTGHTCDGSGTCKANASVPCAPFLCVEKACGTTCATLASDRTNCGICGMACIDRPQASGTCVSGTCGYNCGSGYADCDRSAANGCEVSTSTDANNCGACGLRCTLPHATSGCSGAACVVSACASGFGDCDLNAATGCEATLATDASNCGACGHSCPGRICAAGACVVPHTCLEIHVSDPGLPSGIYTIDPDGAGPAAAFATRCEMTVLGGGWTLVQRTVWDFASESAALITNYDTWYGSTLGVADPGRAFRVAGRNWPTIQSTNDHMMAFTPRHASTGTSCSTLYYTASAGIWTVPAVSGAAVRGTTQRVTIFNTEALSTTDSGPSTSCVGSYGAVPWTYTGCCTTCPTFAGSYFATPRPMVSYLLTTPDDFGNTVAARCGGSDYVVSAGYFGLNAMEYYIR
ncbi:MAG: fibrinogen-like YCDxxxxGGGW domain-containing protein [Deltaproteobacteria bacterium]